jgi:acyl-coenzyme A synthetase/AMP-(fatty) acid ligase
VRRAPARGGAAAEYHRRNVWFVGALPKASTGKILMREIRRP